MKFDNTNTLAAASRALVQLQGISTLVEAIDSTTDAEVQEKGLETILALTRNPCTRNNILVTTLIRAPGTRDSPFTLS